MERWVTLPIVVLHNRKYMIHAGVAYSLGKKSESCFAVLAYYNMNGVIPRQAKLCTRRCSLPQPTNRMRSQNLTRVQNCFGVGMEDASTPIAAERSEPATSQVLTSN